MEDLSCYCIYFRNLAKQITNIYNLGLARLDININQYSILKGLEKLGQSSQTNLAKHLGLERTTLTRTIKPLLDKALIINSSDNPRHQKLSLSPSGERLLLKAHPIWLDLQTDLEKKLGRDALIDAMENLKIL